MARRRGGLDELKEAIDELLRNRATKKAADDQTASASDNADGNADDYVKRAEEICKRNDINMVIENTDNIPAYMKRTYKDLYDNGFRFCYDIGHDGLSYDIIYEINEELNLPFDEFHIHDGTRKKCHLALGDGEIDIKKFKDLAIKNNAFVVIEVKQKSDLLVSVPIFNKL